VSEDRQHTTDATNHLVATPKTQSGSYGAARTFASVLDKRRVTGVVFRVGAGRWSAPNLVAAGSGSQLDKGLGARAVDLEQA
jgi:hypothetical protein